MRSNPRLARVLVLSSFVVVALSFAPSSAQEQFRGHTEVHNLLGKPGCVTRVGNVVGTIAGFWHAYGCFENDGTLIGDFIIQSTDNWSDHLWGSWAATISSATTDLIVELDGTWTILGGNAEWSTASGAGVLKMTFGMMNNDDLLGTWNGPFVTTTGSSPPCLVCPAPSPSPS